MNEDEIRQKKMQQLQERQEFERQKDALLTKLLTPEAKSRLSTVKLANRELAENVEALLIYLYRQGQAQRVDDEQLKALLLKIRDKKRDIQIRRK